MEKKIVNVVVIDPYVRSVDMRQMVALRGPDDEDGPGMMEFPLDDVRKVIFDEVPISRKSGYVQPVSMSGGDTHKITLHAWVDEEGLFADWDEQKFFTTITEDGPYAGRMVLYWEDYKENVVQWPADISVEQVKHGIVWLDAKDVKVPVPTMTTIEPDGTTKTEPLGRPGEHFWTFDNQPSR